MRDQSQVLDVDQSIAPQDLAADTTVDGSAVDLKGFNAATVAIDVGTWTDGTHTFEVQHANDDGTGSPGTFAAVPDADLEGDEPVVDSATTDGQTYKLGYTGLRRHLRVSVTSTGTTTGLADVAAYAVKGVPTNAPV